MPVFIYIPLGPLIVHGVCTAPLLSIHVINWFTGPIAYTTRDTSCLLPLSSGLTDSLSVWFARYNVMCDNMN